MDYTTLVTSEHNQKPNFMALVDAVANGGGGVVTVLEAMPGEFDLGAAVGAQLDIVGEWIGQSRDIPGVLTTAYFGFADTPGAAGFGDVNNPSTGGPFYDLGTTAGSTAVLDDGTYRTVLQAKILANQYGGTLAELETALQLITGVTFSVYDPGTLLVTILLRAAVSAVVQALLTSLDLLPRPGGVKYLALFPLASWTWTVTGTATASGTTAQKATGAAGWDSSAYDVTTYSPILLSWTVPDVTNVSMGGISANPTLDASPNVENGINYGIEANAGTVDIYELGTLVGSFGTYAAGDSFAVYSDGLSAVYLHNGLIIRVVAVAAGSFAPMFAFYSVGAVVDNVAISIS